jgi:hypothetical protein
VFSWQEGKKKLHFYLFILTIKDISFVYVTDKPKFLILKIRDLSFGNLTNRLDEKVNPTAHVAGDQLHSRLLVA